MPGGVALFGPYAGKLDNGGEAIELVRPDTPQAPPHPDAGFVPYIRVDRVAYSDSIPWPSGADGSPGTTSLISLQRLAPSSYGNEPLNWIAAPATAGAINGPAYLNLPTITQQPQDRGGLAGITVSFSVTATGPGPLTYQWRFNGLPLRDATNSTLTIQNLQLANEGLYSVFVGNRAGVVLSSSAVLAVQAPPLITQQPQNQITSPGGNPTFSVIAAGGGLNYRWLFYGTNLPGATSSTLSLSSVQSANAGPYFVVISNISGVVTSETAYLVLTAPAISSDPQTQRVHIGDNVTLSAGITAEPLAQSGIQPAKIRSLALAGLPTSLV